MPIVIPKDIPAFKILENENIFVMTENRAHNQDIRPIEILILNLMPTKIETETQLARLLANTPLQVNLTFLKTETYESTHVAKSHLDKFYKTFDEIKNKNFDGMIITGAPVEHMEFEDVLYIDELKKILDYSKTNVTSSLYICWGAQAALNHFYNIKKHKLDKKIFGVYEHKKYVKFEVLLNGIDDVFYIPQSRHTTINDEDIINNPNLVPLAYSDEIGITIMKSKDNKELFILGHLEYDKFTLKNEYERDLAKGLDIDKPRNYFNQDDDIDVKWRSTANILFYNWLNYYVYQITPFDFKHPDYKKKK